MVTAPARLRRTAANAGSRSSINLPCLLRLGGAGRGEEGDGAEEGAAVHHVFLGTRLR
jgi:hypothetical protein